MDPVGVEDDELGMERDGFWTTLLRPVAELNAYTKSCGGITICAVIAGGHITMSPVIADQ
jgi:hypothetical protein